jgi:hypothetical protein
MNLQGGDFSKLGRLPMSFELSPSDRIKCYRGSNVNRWSVLATLISPLFAVLLSQYLSGRQKCQTTFALPPPSIGVSLPEEGRAEPRLAPQPDPCPALSPSEDSAKNPILAWQAFPLQADKQVRANRLIASAAAAENDPASQFIMLRRAKDVAVEANDGQTAFQVIDSMAEKFHADADAMKMSVLAKLATAARKPAEHKSIAEQALRLGDQAAAREHLIAANQLGRLAVAEAERAFDKNLLAKARSRIAEVAEQVRAKQRASKPSGDWRQQANAGLVQKLDAEAQQGEAADHGDNLLAAKAKRL